MILFLLFVSAVAASSSEVTPFIVHGSSIDQSATFPFTAAIFRQSNASASAFRLICGASILSERFLVTAAHCFIDFDPTDATSRVANWLTPDSFRIAVGQANATNFTQLEQIRQIIKYPGEDALKGKDDVVLVELQNPLEFNSTVNRTRLIRTGSQNLTAIGWGITENLEPSAQLRMTNMHQGDSTKCGNALRHIGLDGDKVYCLGGNDGRTACFGDSGGPLVVNYQGEWLLAAVTSFGYINGKEFGVGGCVSSDLLGFYTKTASYADWISAQTAIDRTQLMVDSSAFQITTSLLPLIFLLMK